MINNKKFRLGLYYSLLVYRGLRIENIDWMKLLDDRANQVANWNLEIQISGDVVKPFISMYLSI